MKTHQNSRELVADYAAGMLHAGLLVGLSMAAALLVATYFC